MKLLDLLSLTMHMAHIQMQIPLDYGIGMFFFPQNELKRNQEKKLFEVIVEKEGMEFLGWRVVPNTPEVLGQKAFDNMPYIMQAFVKRPHGCKKGIEFDRKLYRSEERRGGKVW